MDYLPLFFNLKNAPCLIIGGGSVALRKARLLHQAGAVITLVANEVNSDLRQLVGGDRIHQQPYQSTFLEGKALVVAATDDHDLNRVVHADAVAGRIPINVVDCPALCTFVFPAIVDRSPVIIAVSSGGHAPVLARQLRAKLETWVPHSISLLATFAGEYRQRVKDSIRTLPARRLFWERMFDGPIGDWLAVGRTKEAHQLIADEMALASHLPPAQGEVYLVGAGPGDPELLTFKALKLMQLADVVLYDRLVSPEVLDLVRRDADRIFVGKQRSRHAMPQEDINALLLSLAQAGKRVVRLKGGDPFIFGRGGEELLLLAKAGIPYQVVPGITAASACAAYAGIPLTHRGLATSVKFSTGQLQDNSTPAAIAPVTGIKEQTTRVYYMGLHQLDPICQQLIAEGLSLDCPIALIQSGSTAQQRVVTGTLQTIVQHPDVASLESPTLIIVGDVVSLHPSLAWFHPKSTASA